MYLSYIISFLQLVLPEYGLHAVLMLLFLIGGFWIVFLMNIPLLCYNIYRFVHLNIPIHYHLFPFITINFYVLTHQEYVL